MEEDMERGMHDNGSSACVNANAISTALPSALALLQPSDVEEVRRLHEACFPLKYDEHFYQSLQNGEYGGRDLYSVVVPSSIDGDQDSDTDMDSNYCDENNNNDSNNEFDNNNTVQVHSHDNTGYNTITGEKYSNESNEAHALSVNAALLHNDRGIIAESAQPSLECNSKGTANGLTHSLEQVSISTSPPPPSHVTQTHGEHQHNPTQHSTEQQAQNVPPAHPPKRPRQVCAGAIAQICDRMQGEDATGLLSPQSIREGITQCCYILTVAVHESHRRQGLATRLLNACIDYARADKRCGVVYLHVITNNPAALAFYECNGFSHVKTCENFYRIGTKNHNAFVYALYLPPALPTLHLAKRLKLVRSKKKNPASSSHSSWPMPQWKRGRKVDRLEEDVLTTEEDAAYASGTTGSGSSSSGGGWWSRVVSSFGQWIRSIGVVVGLDGNNERESDADAYSITRIDGDNTADNA